MLRAIIIAHRWLGVAVCLLFVPWFISGIVMMYGGGFPEIKQDERLAHAALLESSKVRLTVADGWARLGQQGRPEEARLAMQDGRPVYRFRSARKLQMVYADDGSKLNPASFAREAAAWIGLQAGAATTEVLTEPDQWTVQSPYRALRPLTKFSWPAGEEVYVSHVTGEVVQATTSKKRLAAYCGAVIHWLYFLPLRRNGSVWSNTVIWLSGIGTVVSVLGIVVGLWLYSPSRKTYKYAGKPSSVGFSGQKRWHMILGLIFGLTTFGWVLSGLLSMDPIPFEGVTGGEFHAKIAGALRGELDLRRFEMVGELPREFATKEVEFAVVAGETVYLAAGAGRQYRMLPASTAAIATARLAEIVQNSVAPMKVAEVREVTQYETYYGDRHGDHPLPAVLVRLADESNSMFYIDPKTARIAQSHDARSRWGRWLYQWLHLMDLPALYQNRPLWDILMLVFLLGGTAISVTSIALGVQVLQRKLSAR